MKKLWTCVGQRKVGHGKVDDGVGKYNQISFFFLTSLLEYNCFTMVC